MCTERPASPFANVSSSVGDDGALISWEYWGSEKNVYVEYIANNSKQASVFLSTLPLTTKSPILCYWHVQVNRNVGNHQAFTSTDPVVLKTASCDWIANC